MTRQASGLKSRLKYPIWLELGLVGLLLVLGLHLRLNTFTYPYYYEDGNRDYLIAHHILKYGDLPIQGPISSFFNSLTNSPVYLYFLAALLLIHDDVVSLGIANIGLQLFNCLFIYLLARVLFGKLTAFIALSFFALSQIGTEQSRFYLWQSWQMQPFINLSYLLLILAYVKKKYSLMFWGLGVLAFAFVLHNSVAAVLPMMMILNYFSLKKIGFSYKRALISVGIVVIVFAASFWPLLLYLNHDGFSQPGTPFKNLVIGPLDYIQNFTSNFVTLVNLFFQTNVKTNFYLNYLLVITFFSLLFGYLLINKPKDRIWLIMGGVLILQPIIILSFFNLTEPSLTQSTPYLYGLPRYFTPILGLTIILIAQVASFFIRKVKWVGILAGGFMIGFIWLNLFQGIDNLTIFKYPQHWQWDDPLVRSIQSEVSDIQTKNNYSSPNFFQLKYVGIEYIESSLWVVLERNFDYKFIQTADAKTGNYYYPLNDDKYIFLISRRYYGDPNFLEKFMLQHPYYKLVKSIHLDDKFSSFLLIREY